METRIGLLYWESSKDPADYRAALERAGASAVRLDGDALCRLPLSRALKIIGEHAPDGLLIPGGADIDSAWWDEPLHPSAKCVPAPRDAFEIYLARAYYDCKRPILGICRGAQVLAVALGGTLYQDVVSEGFDQHRLDGNQGHLIAVEPGSLVAGVFQANVGRVNSAHHQSIRQPGPQLAITAWARGRLPEAIEARDGRPCWGVQWHPERMPADPAARRLFQAFADACSKARATVF